MKKTITIILLLTINIFYAQVQRLDSIVGNDFNMIFLYDNDNIYQGYETKQFDNTNWINDEKITILYNNDGLVSTQIRKKWNGTEYLNNAKINFEYNSNHQISIVTFYDWDTNAWVNDGNEGTYIYGNNLKTEYIVAGQDKIIYTYDTNNLLIKLEIFDWVENTNTFSQITNHKYEYSYDSENNIEQIVQSIKNSDGVWNVEELTVHYYDNTVDREHLIIPFSLVSFEIKIFDFNHKLTETILNNDSNTTMVYYYSNVTTADVLEYRNSISIYPNPTTNQIKFDITDFEKIEIYDITGKLITKTKTNIVNMENVPNGTYLYRIQKGNKTINGKIIKK